MRQGLILPLFSSCLLINFCFAADLLDTVEDELILEEVSIVGSRTKARQIAGAAAYLGSEQLERFSYSDIQSILRSVPGISLQTEDGFGLRPNISIRGVATERSSRITLLEDNVLVAPAPYAAPAAYYFPTPGRIHSIEILKGPAAITQGPYTIGGALNMISTPVSDDNHIDLMLEAGANETYRGHASLNRRISDQMQILLETHQWQSDGFQHFQENNQDTGLDVQDYMFKFRYQSENDRHQVELKLQETRQVSNQSYLGLTDSDFQDSPLLRYNVSALDKMQSQHQQAMIQYRFSPTDSSKLVITAYQNRLYRNWFKTQGIDLDGSLTNAGYSGLSWNKVIAAINLDQSLNDFTPAFLSGLLQGTYDTPAGSIQLRANARHYLSRGIQAKFERHFEIGNSQHELELGIRIHEDYEDRLQRNSTYHQASGALILNDLGKWGNAGNQVQSARAYALHLHDNIKINHLTLSPGIRFEYIHQQRTRWETRPQLSPNPSSRDHSNLRDQRENRSKIWLPGLAALYQLNDATALVAGVHRGFSAAGNAPGAREESSVNYELGIRMDNSYELEAIYFLSDYDNILGQCTASSGSQCTTGDVFNGDAATVQGLELSASTRIETSGYFAIPLSISYTWLDSQFDSDIADTDFFGDVSRGDPIPYLPEQQLQLAGGLVGARWSHFINLNYQMGVCVRASCGPFEKTENSTTVDLTSQLELNGATQIFFKLENALNAQHIVGRQPYGARTNRDRTATVGFRLSL